MKIAVAQVNPTVGNLDGNAGKILDNAEEAASQGAELVVFPSMALTGGPLKGLGRTKAFVADAMKHMEKLASELPVLSLVSCVFDVASFPYNEKTGPDYSEKESETGVATGLFIVGEDEVQLLYAPEFEVPGACPIVWVGDKRIAVLLDKHYNQIKLEGADVMVEICADAYTQEFAAEAAMGRISRFMQLTKMCNAFLVYANLCGAQDSTVFAGNSTVFAPNSRMAHAAELDQEDLYVFSTEDDRMGTRGEARAVRRDDDEVIWRGIVVGTRDYVVKNGFSDVLVGLSGGLDSSVVATAAVDALGAEHVHGLLMPGPYSSEGSLTDAAELADNLGIQTWTVPITEALDCFNAVLAEPCGGEVKGLAEENVQARIRAVYLLTTANAHGWLVLNTGNKSEAAMGFSTLGGDTAGVYAPVGQMYKSDLYPLAQWRMQKGPSIPQAAIDKAPSAELYPGAKDQDRLPPYELLDETLLDHVEGGLSAGELVEKGTSSALARNVLSGLVQTEFKRRLEPMGPKVMGLSLNDDRDWPVTNAWRDTSADEE